MICKKCNTDRPLNRFRLRTKRGYTYRLRTCMECEATAQRERYNKIKDIPEFKQLNRNRVNKYRVNNIDVIREKQQARRQTAHAKISRKNYIASNKDKIFKQEKICKKRYHDKNRDELSDIYVTSVLIGNTKGIYRNEIPPPLIKIKRLQLLGKRILKQQSLKQK